jgi:hypothetical protein
VGVLANPDGLRERLTNRHEHSAEGVVPALRRALRAFPGAQVTIRLHPRQDPARIVAAFAPWASVTFDPLPAQSALPEFVAAHHLIVGSYSMGLMMARLLGRPAVSFQPPIPDHGIRREIFAVWDVPVAATDDEFAAMIAERLADARPALAPDTVLYEPHGSLAAITAVVLEAQMAGTAPERRVAAQRRGRRRRSDSHRHGQSHPRTGRVQQPPAPGRSSTRRPRHCAALRARLAWRHAGGLAGTGRADRPR